MNETVNKKFKVILFFSFWIFTILDIILSFSATKLFLTLIIFLPITILILINKHVPSLFILLLFCVFEILMNLLGIFAMFQNEEFPIMSIILIVVSVFFYVLLFDATLKVLRNKEKVNSKYFLIVLLVFLISLIASFSLDIVNNAFNMNQLFPNLVYLLSQLIIHIYFVIYLVLTEFKEIEVFI